MTASSWMPLGPPGPAEIPLFMLPPAGGSAALYQPGAWVAVAPGVRVCPVEPPGRGARLAEPPLTSAEELVAGLDLACRPRDGRLWAVLGHSMGALAAAAWAAAAHDQGHGPSVLYLSAAAPPWAYPIAAELVACDDEELWARMSAVGGVPAAYRNSPAAARLFTPIMRADIQAVAALGAASVGCPVVVLCGAEDPAVPRRLLVHWREIAVGDFTVRLLPGAHFYQGGIGDLAGIVRTDLSQRLARGNRHG